MTEPVHDYWDASYWDAEPEQFDDEPDHGLLDQDVRAAWARLRHRHGCPCCSRRLDTR